MNKLVKISKETKIDFIPDKSEFIIDGFELSHDEFAINGHFYTFPLINRKNNKRHIKTKIKS